MVILSISTTKKGLLTIIVIFSMIILGAISDVHEDVKKNGWVYERTIIIGTEATYELVYGMASVITLSFLAISILFMTVGLKHLVKLSEAIYTLDYSKANEAGYGIDFPKGKPEHWTIEVDPMTEKMLVELGEHSVEFKAPFFFRAPKEAT